MKTNLILLVDADADSVGFVLEAAARTGHGVRFAQTSSEAFEVLVDGPDKVDAVIVDLDPGAHGLALLEAVSGCREKPPLLVLSGLEETYMRVIAARHGAAACLGKPVSLERMCSTLRHLLADQVMALAGRSCDKGGRLCEHATR